VHVDAGQQDPGAAKRFKSQHVPSRSQGTKGNKPDNSDISLVSRSALAVHTASVQVHSAKIP
jgi:hypothetical protein